MGVKIFLASWRQVSGFFGEKSIQSLYAAKTVMALALSCIQAQANANAMADLAVSYIRYPSAND